MILKNRFYQFTGRYEELPDSLKSLFDEYFLLGIREDVSNKGIYLECFGEDLLLFHTWTNENDFSLQDITRLVLECLDDLKPSHYDECEALLSIWNTFGFNAVDGLRPIIELHADEHIQAIWENTFNRIVYYEQYLELIDIAKNQIGEARLSKLSHVMDVEDIELPDSSETIRSLLKSRATNKSGIFATRAEEMDTHLFRQILFNWY